MRKYMICLIGTVLFLWSSVCSAEAIYNTREYYSGFDGALVREAYIADHFDDLHIGLCICKASSVDTDGTPFYAYKIIILQTLPIAVNVEELAILSPIDSVVIPERDFKRKNRTVGTEIAQDVVMYRDNPGKINSFVDNISTEMVIRVRVNDNKIYDLYPSQEFIDGLKAVAKWS